MAEADDIRSSRDEERTVHRDLKALRAGRIAAILARLEADPNAWIPTEDLITILLARTAEAIPPSLLRYVRARLDVPRPRGRRQPGASRQLYNELIFLKFESYEAWLTKRKSSRGLEGWSCIRAAEWWQGPPSERAARMVQRRLGVNAGWERVRNIAYEVRRRRSRARRTSSPGVRGGTPARGPGASSRAWPRTGRP